MEMNMSSMASSENTTTIEHPSSTNKLPSYTHRFFWDVDPMQLEIDEHYRYVVERLLEYGDLPAVRWLLAFFSPQDIIPVLQTRRRLSPFSANYWALFFDVNKENILCLSTPSLREPKPIWPY